MPAATTAGLVFATDHATITRAVDIAARAIPSRAATATNQQVLTGLLLAAGADGMVSVTAFDYEVATTVRNAGMAAGSGRVLAPGMALRDVVKGAGKGRTASVRDTLPIVMHADDNRWMVECDGARTALTSLPVDEYPTVPPMPDVIGHVDGPAFLAAVQQVAPAAGRDDTLPVLTGVRIEWDGDMLTLASTDRYRLAVRTLPWRPVDPAASGSMLIPARTLTTFAKDLAPHGELTIASGHGPSGEMLAGFAAGPIESTTRLVEGMFPPYRKLLPDTHPLAADVDRTALANAVRRVALVAPKTAPVRLTFTADMVRLDAGSHGGEAQASETVPATYDGPTLEVAFNPVYLVDALTALTPDRITVGFQSADIEVAAKKPAVLTGDGAPEYRYLLMPIQLNG